MIAFKGKLQISTEPLAPRTIERSELPALRAWKVTPAARRGGGDATRTFCEQEMGGGYDQAGSPFERERRWIVKKRGLLGFLGLHGIDPTRRRAEVGILPDPEARGREIGGGAPRFLLDEGFIGLNLHRLFLHMRVDRRFARNMYKRCGFQPAVRLRRHDLQAGRYAGVIVMGALAGEHATRDGEEGSRRLPW